jgi:hypothetical protein
MEAPTPDPRIVGDPVGLADSCENVGSVVAHLGVLADDVMPGGSCQHDD